MKKILIIICLLFISCTSSIKQSPKSQSPKPLTPKREIIKQKVTFELLVRDKERTLEGAKIDYKIFKEDFTGREIVKEDSYITKADGILVETVQGLLDIDFILDYNVIKEGYYPQMGALKTEWSEEVNKVIESTIILERLPEHIYELFIVDIDGNPIGGAKIDYVLKKVTTAGTTKIIKSGEYITEIDGKFLERIFADIGTLFFTTHFNYKVTKNGYYPEEGYMDLFTEQSTQKKSKNIILIRPIDYLTREFAESEESGFLREQISGFITWVLLESQLADTILKTQSIDLISFKEKKYLTFKFINSNVYNSLKLSKYDIGGILFDEIVRKILNPLNEYIGGSESFDGYDIGIIGHTKDFTEEHAIAQSIEYRFMIPESAVRKYKNKDITGQALLNQSIILMDDERIELKLQ